MGNPKPSCRVYVVGPTESVLTRRGNRHPAFARYIHDTGFEVTYITSDFYHAEKRHFSSDEIAEACSDVPYKLHVLPCLGYTHNISVKRVISNIFLTVRIFLYMIRRVDSNSIIVFPSRPVELILAMGLIRTIRKSSVALDIQDIWPDMLVINSRFKRRLFWCYCGAYLHPGLRMIDKFFHVAPSFEKWLKRYNHTASSVFIPLGYDADRWINARPKQHPIEKSSFEFVCVSQLTFQFDLIPFLEVLADHPDHRLKIIGENGKGERHAEVLLFIKAKGMKNVQIIGHVSRDDLVQLLGDADIGIVPMISTSIPNKVFDYIAGYLPLLVLGTNDAGEFAEQLNVGWSVPSNKEAISALLARLTIPEVQEKVNSLRLHRSEFDRSRLHGQILKLIFP